MYEQPSVVDIKVVHQETGFLGPDDFARRSLGLGKLVAAISAHARTETPNVRAERAARQNLESIRSEAENDYFVDKSLDAYQRRMEALFELRSRRYSNDRLFRTFFERSPLDNVNVSWYAGGLVFWLMEMDFQHTLVLEREGTVDEAIRRASVSAAVSYGTYQPEVGSDRVPVAGVKCYDQEQRLFTDGVLPGEIEISKLTGIVMNYPQDGALHKDGIFPLIDSDSKPGLAFVESVDDETDETHMSLPGQGEKLLLEHGPYALDIQNGTIHFSFVKDFKKTPYKADGYELCIIYNGEFNKHGKLSSWVVQDKQDSVFHELQHLVNSIRRPQRSKKSLQAHADSSTVSTMAKQMLHGPLDQDIHDEFLAMITTPEVSFKSAINHMIEQVENIGIAYNYLNSHQSDIAQMVREREGEFSSVSSGTHQISAEIADQYRAHLSDVIAALSYYAQTHPKMTRQGLIGLLVPHPFHAWPTVMRSVARYQDQRTSA